MSPLPPTKSIPAGELLQHVSRTAYRGHPLHFGRGGTHRFDSSDRSYGVLYLAFDLDTALMESVFHQHRWHLRKTRAIALAEVEARMVRAVGVLDGLRLADLTAPGVMARHFGLNLAQLSGRRYLHTHRISRSVYEARRESGEPCFDGLLYPSRNNYPALCVALFDRAGHKLAVVDDIDLAEHADWPRFVADHRVGILATGKGRARRRG